MGKYDNNAVKASATKFANSPARMQSRLDEKFGGFITIHSGYTGFRFPAKFHCSKHDVVFEVPRAEAMIHDRVGCPTCGRESSKAKRQLLGTHHTTDSYRKAVADKHGNRIRVIGEYLGYTRRSEYSKKTLHSCRKHGEFEAWPESILLTQYGCPSCAAEKKIARHDRLTQSQFRKCLKEVNPTIRHIGVYVNRTTKTEFRCRNCGYEWSTVPEAVLREKRRTGCNACFVTSARSNWNGTVFKEYRLGRRTVQVRGYEPQALDYLLSKGYQPNQIFVGKDVPRIRYYHDGKARWYYPDIWIPHENLIVEVKSTYFFGATDINLFRSVKAKREATLQHHNFALLVMSEDGNKVNVPRDWYRMPHSRLKKMM